MVLDTLKNQYCNLIFKKTDYEKLKKAGIDVYSIKADAFTV